MKRTANDMAWDALNAACLSIQNELGVTSGDFASRFFSGEVGEQVLSLFEAYAKAETQEQARASTSTDALLERLSAAYPDKKFDLVESGVIFLIADDVAIFDPTISDCGRFESEDFYGLSSEDAEALRDYNLTINPNLPET